VPHAGEFRQAGSNEYANRRCTMFAQGVREPRWAMHEIEHDVLNG
jgi:hypothetical protein